MESKIIKEALVELGRYNIRKNEYLYSYISIMIHGE